MIFWTIIAAIALFGFMSVGHWTSKSWFYPPVLYSAYWAIILITCSVTHIWSYELSTSSILVFVAGCAAFLIAGLLATSWLRFWKSETQLSPGRRSFMHRWIRVGSLVVLFAVPGFIFNVNQVADTYGISSFAVASHYALSRDDRLGIPRFFLSSSAVGMALAYCAAWLYEGRKRDMITLLIALIGPLLLTVLSFSRTATYTLLVGTVGIMSVRGFLRKGRLVLLVVGALSLSMVMGAFLDKLPGFEWGVKGLAAVAESLATYFIGGPLGFAQVMDRPSLVGEFGLSLRFFTQTFNSFGGDLVLPSNILGYVRSDLGNVYTIYFAYWLDGSWLGILIMAFIAGLLCTVVYEFTLRGNPVAGCAWGLVISSLLNSATGDGLFGSAMPWLVLLSAALFLWRIPLGHSTGIHNAKSTLKQPQKRTP